MKQYTKHVLITKKQYKNVLLISMIVWAQESSKSEVQLEWYEDSMTQG
jgi:hypothetical protein